MDAKVRRQQHFCQWGQGTGRAGEGQMDPELRHLVVCLSSVWGSRPTTCLAYLLRDMGLQPTVTLDIGSDRPAFR